MIIIKNKLIIALILILAIFSFTACHKQNNSYNVYNKKQLESCTVVNDIKDVKFEIPSTLFSNTKTKEDFVSLISANTDTTKKISDILENSTIKMFDNDEYFLSDFNNFFYNFKTTENQTKLSDYNTTALLENLLSDYKAFDNFKIDSEKDFSLSEKNNVCKIILPIIHKDTHYGISFKGYISIIDIDNIFYYFINTYKNIDETTNAFEIAKSFEITNNKIHIENDDEIFNANFNELLTNMNFKTNDYKISDFTLYFNDNEIKLPISYKDFSTKTNFTISDDNLEKKLQPNTTITVKAQYKNKTISIILANIGNKEIGLNETNIIGIKTDEVELYNNSFIFTRIVLPQNIIVHKSNYDDIVKKYGTPTEIVDTENSNFKTLIYKLGTFESDIYTKLELTINKETNLLYGFEYTNLRL